MKKKATKEDFINFLLQQRQLVEDQVVDYYKKGSELEPPYEGDEKSLRREAEIFSLWLLTISAPLDRDFLDSLHDTFCESEELNSQEKDIFYKELAKRYDNYNEAFNMWTKRSNSGHIMGGVMVEIIKNQNPNFSLKNELPMSPGALDSAMAFSQFASLFKYLVEVIGELKRKFDIEVYLGQQDFTK